MNGEGETERLRYVVRDVGERIIKQLDHLNTTFEDIDDKLHDLWVVADKIRGNIETRKP